MDTLQNRIDTLLRGIMNLNQNDTISFTFIIIHTSIIFAEVKDNDTLSETFLPQIEVLLTLLELKTQKTFGTLVTELDTIYS
jgi:hypothetical protein